MWIKYQFGNVCISETVVICVVSMSILIDKFFIQCIFNVNFQFFTLLKYTITYIVYDFLLEILVLYD